ncbi:MAG: hypothetical protein EZS28_002610 [Streblomastix strix]|uniref:Uncharacterized protein n=1 Tax=Streblomastix strix TaxID=222440 RepID=A0A5J4X4F8_9EUKA|nr:MAG: hypothetical protein EZS28_002610 [Streblomastix strix]
MSCGGGVCGRGVLPPRDVYSAVIKNTKTQPLEVSVHYAGLEPGDEEVITLTVAPGSTADAPEKSVTKGTATFHKVIKKIVAGNDILEAPFQGVGSPTKGKVFEF